MALPFARAFRQLAAEVVKRTQEGQPIAVIEEP
jgi:hypothetical protein